MLNLVAFGGFSIAIVECLIVIAGVVVQDVLFSHVSTIVFIKHMIMIVVVVRLFLKKNKMNDYINYLQYGKVRFND
jgi:hypothetical protein